jgi:hypothetical protein
MNKKDDLNMNIIRLCESNRKYMTGRDKVLDNESNKIVLKEGLFIRNKDFIVKLDERVEKKVKLEGRERHSNVFKSSETRYTNDHDDSVERSFDPFSLLGLRTSSRSEKLLFEEFTQKLSNNRSMSNEFCKKMCKEGLNLLTSSMGNQTLGVKISISPNVFFAIMNLSSLINSDLQKLNDARNLGEKVLLDYFSIEEKSNLLRKELNLLEKDKKSTFEDIRRKEREYIDSLDKIIRYQNQDVDKLIKALTDDRYYTLIMSKEASKEFFDEEAEFPMSDYEYVSSIIKEPRDRDLSEEFFDEELSETSIIKSDMLNIRNNKIASLISKIKDSEKINSLNEYSMTRSRNLYAKAYEDARDGWERYCNMKRLRELSDYDLVYDHELGFIKKRIPKETPGFRAKEINKHDRHGRLIRDFSEDSLYYTKRHIIEKNLYKWKRIQSKDSIDKKTGNVRDDISGPDSEHNYSECNQAFEKYVKVQYLIRGLFDKNFCEKNNKVYRTIHDVYLSKNFKVKSRIRNAIFEGKLPQFNLTNEVLESVSKKNPILGKFIQRESGESLVSSNVQKILNPDSKFIYLQYGLYLRLTYRVRLILIQFFFQELGRVDSFWRNSLSHSKNFFCKLEGIDNFHNLYDTERKVLIRKNLGCPIYGYAYKGSPILDYLIMNKASREEKEEMGSKINVIMGGRSSNLRNLLLSSYKNPIRINHLLLNSFEKLLSQTIHRCKILLDMGLFRGLCESRLVPAYSDGTDEFKIQCEFVDSNGKVVDTKKLFNLLSKPVETVYTTSRFSDKPDEFYLEESCIIDVGRLSTRTINEPSSKKVQDSERLQLFKDNNETGNQIITDGDKILEIIRSYTRLYPNCDHIIISRNLLNLKSKSISEFVFSFEPSEFLNENIKDVAIRNHISKQISKLLKNKFDIFRYKSITWCSDILNEIFNLIDINSYHDLSSIMDTTKAELEERLERSMILLSSQKDLLYEKEMNLHIDSQYKFERGKIQLGRVYEGENIFDLHKMKCLLLTQNLGLLRACFKDNKLLRHLDNFIDDIIIRLSTIEGFHIGQLRNYLKENHLALANNLLFMMTKIGDAEDFNLSFLEFLSENHESFLFFSESKIAQEYAKEFLYLKELVTHTRKLETKLKDHNLKRIGFIEEINKINQKSIKDLQLTQKSITESKVRIKECKRNEVFNLPIHGMEGRKLVKPSESINANDVMIHIISDDGFKVIGKREVDVDSQSFGENFYKNVKVSFGHSQVTLHQGNNPFKNVVNDPNEDNLETKNIMINCKNVLCSLSDTTRKEKIMSREFISYSLNPSLIEVSRFKETCRLRVKTLDEQIRKLNIEISELESKEAQNVNIIKRCNEDIMKVRPKKSNIGELSQNEKRESKGNKNSKSSLVNNSDLKTYDLTDKLQNLQNERKQKDLENKEIKKVKSNLEIDIKKSRESINNLCNNQLNQIELIKQECERMKTEDPILLKSKFINYFNNSEILKRLDFDKLNLDFKSFFSEDLNIIKSFAADLREEIKISDPKNSTKSQSSNNPFVKYNKLIDSMIDHKDKRKGREIFFLLINEIEICISTLKDLFEKTFEKKRNLDKFLSKIQSDEYKLAYKKKVEDYISFEKKLYFVSNESPLETRKEFLDDIFEDSIEILKLVKEFDEFQDQISNLISKVFKFLDTLGEYNLEKSTKVTMSRFKRLFRLNYQGDVISYKVCKQPSLVNLRENVKVNLKSRVYDLDEGFINLSCEYSTSYANEASRFVLSKDFNDKEYYKLVKSCLTKVERGVISGRRCNQIFTKSDVKDVIKSILNCDHVDDGFRRTGFFSKPNNSYGYNINLDAYLNSKSRSILESNDNKLTFKGEPELNDESLLEMKILNRFRNRGYVADLTSRPKSSIPSDERFYEIQLLELRARNKFLLNSLSRKQRRRFNRKESKSGEYSYWNNEGWHSKEVLERIRRRTLDRRKNILMGKSPTSKAEISDDDENDYGSPEESSDYDSDSYESFSTSYFSTNKFTK